ncbi:histidine phosphatase family protein [Glutamicibacter arilaitensis]|uniref:histidine phosphatase family protein n=1 Tax=Glutamicibacter arilaitensis TaxID=256701 RepID=UPI000EC8DD20|nr:histidine phosphatase family protein [Glutamicibacter sp.]
METSLALVRHGQTDWNLAGRLQGRTDIPLNETGREQARAVGRALAGQGWSLILGSPLERAQETATLMAEQLGAATGDAVPELIERGFGPLESRIMAEVSEEETAAAKDQLEPRADILSRAIPALLELAKAHAGTKIMIVSHGATMRNIRDALAGTKEARGVENGEVLDIDLRRLQQLADELDLVAL